MSRPESAHGPATPIDASGLEPSTGSGYPPPFHSRVLPRERRALGDAAGLTRIGINHTTLGAGAQSALRHWHTHEDELVYVLSGEVILVTDEGERPLSAGMCVGFPAGAANGHHLQNRSVTPAVYLEISNREPADSAAYPDQDLRWNAPDARGVYSHRDGSLY